MLQTLRPPSDAIQTRRRIEEDAAVVVEDEEVGAEATRRRRAAEDVEVTREEIGAAVERATIRALGAAGATMRREG